MGEDDRKGYRDDLGAALEKVARLEEENRSLRADLARKHEPPRAAPPAPAVHSPSASGISILGAGAVIGLAMALLVALRGSSSPPVTLPPLATIVAAPPPSLVLPAPFHLYDAMPSATVAPPTAGPNERHVEVRSSPPGATVERAGKVIGKTPLFVNVTANSAGACSPGLCTGGACVGARCNGAECTGATCSGATCSGQTCPRGFTCRGGGACTSSACTGASCAGGSCPNGAGGTCSGGSCTGGTCEAVTPIVLALGPERAKLDLTADAPVVGHLFLGRKFP